MNERDDIMTDLFDYFPNDIEYPSSEEVISGVPKNGGFDYVPSLYIDAMCKYTGKCFFAIMFERYRDWDDEYTEELITQDIDEFKKDVHSSYSVFKDDIFLLTETDTEYWLYWVDKDCSDCCIYRVDKDNVESKEVLIESIKIWLNQNPDYGRTIELPLPKLDWFYIR